MILLLFFLLFSPPDQGYDKYLIVVNEHECVLVQDAEKPVQLGDLLDYAISRGFSTIRVHSGEWVFTTPIAITASLRGLTIRGDSPPPSLHGDFSITRSANVNIENLVLHGDINLDLTFNVQIRSVYFDRGGINLKGNRCNQPRECTSYHRNIRIEECTFKDSMQGIRADRLEFSFIQGNRFIGEQMSNGCEKVAIGIELDGSSEDLDRPLELGHSKGNQILQNSFEQEFAIGIRVRDSLANTIRDNHFVRSYRALEFQDGARHNQVSGNYIGYLSQQSVTSACPGPCGIYVGPGTVNNIFLNNFFEQNVELQFLDRNRNNTFVIDESGNQNVFHSDFTRITH